MLRNNLQWLNAQHLSGITAFGSCSNCELSLFAWQITHSRRV